MHLLHICYTICKKGNHVTVPNNTIKILFLLQHARVVLLLLLHTSFIAILLKCNGIKQKGIYHSIIQFFRILYSAACLNLKAWLRWICYYIYPSGRIRKWNHTKFASCNHLEKRVKIWCAYFSCSLNSRNDLRVVVFW